MTIYLWGAGASVLAIGMETAFVRYEYHNLFPWILLPALALNYCIYQVVHGSTTLFAAFALFGLFNALARLGISAWLGQPITRGMWMATALLAVANLVKGLK